METVMEEVEYIPPDDSAWNCELDISQLCRICANPNEYLIPIFQDEGLEHDLINKINKHLPIKVTERDKLPTNLCYQCASTLIAWHDMVIGCLEADERLKALIHDENYVDDKQIVDDCSAQFINEVEINSGEIKSYVPQRAEATEAMDVQDVVHVIKQDPTSESIKVVEENTALEPEFTEEVSSDPRSLSFRNYQIATWALRDKLLKLNVKKKNYTSIRNKLSNNIQDKTSFKEKFCETLGEVKEDNCSSLLDNVKRNYTDSKSKHECDVCSRLFSRASTLKRHRLVHLFIEHFENKESGKANDQDMHKINSLLLSKPILTFTCEVCARIFKAKDSYERHKRIHTGERPFQCSECSKRFRDSGALSRHVKEVHAKIRNHPCNVCNKWFVNRATLEDHYRTHTGERPYVCHQCGVMFKTKAALYQHNKIHSNYFPYICVYCGKCFRRRQELVAHTPIHTNEKTHICEKCGKGFSTRSELQRHIVVHSEEKPFSCLSCGVNFSQKRYLKNHEKLRHGKTEDLQTTGLIPVESLTFTS